VHAQGVDTTTPGGKALFQMMGVFAEFERAMIRERVCAGLDKARAKGKRLGRPGSAHASKGPSGSVWRPAKSSWQLPATYASVSPPCAEYWAPEPEPRRPLQSIDLVHSFELPHAQSAGSNRGLATPNTCSCSSDS
jgi:hypothetical protein